jgi:hypothetical protein
MTRISNADHVLLLLRNHLERTQKQRRKRTQSSRGDEHTGATPLQRIERLALVSELPAHELKRALVAAVLAEELGEAVMNDAKFHRVVDEVLRIIATDERASAQLQQACKTLSEPPG